MEGYADYKFIKMKNSIYFKELPDFPTLYMKKYKDFCMTVLSPSNWFSVSI